MKLLNLFLSASALAGMACSANAALVAYYPIDSATDTGQLLDEIIEDASHPMTNATTNTSGGSIINDATRGDVLSTVQGHRLNGGTQGIDLNIGFTWSFWVSQGDNSDSGADVIVGTRGTSNGSWHKVQADKSENWRTISYSSPIAASGWQHVAYTGDLNGLEMYINGSSVGTTGAGSSGFTFNGNWEIGGSSTFSEDWAGLIDDIAIWNERLPEAQIQSLASGTSPLAIPETSTFALIGLAGAALFVRRRRS
jgi:hypothetical protein